MSSAEKIYQTAPKYDADKLLTSWNINDYLGNGASAAARRCYYNDKVLAVKRFYITGTVKRVERIAQRFKREAVILHLLEHQNIVKIHGITEWSCSECLGLVMEYIPGGTLEDLLDEESSDIPWELRLRFMLDMTEALKYLHHHHAKRRIVHGDLKPQNILLDLDLNIKLTDFGSTNVIKATGVTRMTLDLDTTREYTEFYVAPEMLKKPTPPVKCSMDIYSLSMVNYNVMTRSLSGNIEEEKLQSVEEELQNKPSDLHIFKVLRNFLTCGSKEKPEKRPKACEINQCFKKEFDKIDPVVLLQKIQPLRSHLLSEQKITQTEEKVKLSTFCGDDFRSISLSSVSDDTPLQVDNDDSSNQSQTIDTVPQSALADTNLNSLLEEAKKSGAPINIIYAPQIQDYRQFNQTEIKDCTDVTLPGGDVIQNQSVYEGSNARYEVDSNAPIPLYNMQQKATCSDDMHLSQSHCPAGSDNEVFEAEYINQDNEEVHEGIYVDDYDEIEMKISTTENPVNNGVSIAVADPYNLPPVVPEQDDDMKNNEVFEAEYTNQDNEEVHEGIYVDDYDEIEMKISTTENPDELEKSIYDTVFDESSKYVSLFDFEAKSRDEISVGKGDVVHVLERDLEENFWKVESQKTKKIGLAVSNIFIPKQWFFKNKQTSYCEQRLIRKETFSGNFMITDHDGKLILTVLHIDSNMSKHPYHYDIEFPFGNHSCRLHDRQLFPSIVKLIQYYQSINYIDELTKQICCQLTVPCPSSRRHKSLQLSIGDLELLQQQPFGNIYRVWKGLLYGTLKVFIKTADEDQCVNHADLLPLQIVNHDNIASFFGMTTQQPVWIVTEYLSKGTILEFFDTDEGKSTDLSHHIFYGYQISKGMNHLEQQSYPHGHLQAEHILIGHKNQCKIAGFGYYKCQKMVDYRTKWSSPEVLKNGRGSVSIKSDVWSFGILLTEIFTKGKEPYQGMSLGKLIEQLKRGYRIPKRDILPDNSFTENLYSFLLQCWLDDYQQRPTFQDIRMFLESCTVKDAD
ncbi:unnamed protein product [Clavelina lepadiformis]|uniref:non-specific protein-tyrosine kinase n=1 Tax=Clavelina lepadiformis TaxID=159417 RepID=A0ABP0GN83_CLALP